MKWYRLVSGRALREGECLPWWMGIAWRPEHLNAVVCLPLGLHWLAGAVRAGYYACRFAVFPDEERLAYERGFKDGEAASERGYWLQREALVESAKAEVLTMLDRDIQARRAKYAQ